MARYIKANPKVAEYLNLQTDRNTVADGNYILWQSDMLAFGPLTRLPETLTAIGAIALMPHEARQEQDGTVTRPLPVATDPRFIIPLPEPEESEESADGDPAEPVEVIETIGDVGDEPLSDTPAEPDETTETAETADAEDTNL